MQYFFWILGIIILLVSIISPINIFIGGLVGIILVVIGIIIKMTRNKRS